MTNQEAILYMVLYRAKLLDSVSDLDKDIEAYDMAIKALEQEPKTGHWINVNEGKWNTIPVYKCSACGENADLRDWSGESPFCPWCGARMVEPQESEG